MAKNWRVKECDTYTFALLWIHNTVNYMCVKLTNVDMFKFQNFQIKSIRVIHEILKMLADLVDISQIIMWFMDCKKVIIIITVTYNVLYPYPCITIAVNFHFYGNKYTYIHLYYFSSHYYIVVLIFSSTSLCYCQGRKCSVHSLLLTMHT